MILPFTCFVWLTCARGNVYTLNTTLHDRRHDPRPTRAAATKAPPTMSRSLTTSQIIELGDYLKPDFDPQSLTIPQLLGIFGFHGVMYPTPHTKAKLVAVFNEQIKSRAEQYKQERLARQNSQASDEGVTDGLTGRPLNEERKRTTRAASRRASLAPKDQNEPAPEPSKPEPAKRRRASAEPSVGRATSRRRATKAPEPATVAEESEPDEPPVKKVSRKKTSTTEAATQSRAAAARAREDIDSGWEDNNIFQSGAESASPSPVKPRTRRSSAIPTRSKKSMSVPPQFAPPPSPPKESPSKIPRRRAAAVKPPESEFEPELPDTVFQESKATTSRARLATPEVMVASRGVAVEFDQEESKVEMQEEAIFTAPSPRLSPKASPKPSPKRPSPRSSLSPRKQPEPLTEQDTKVALSVIEERTEKSESQLDVLSQAPSDEGQDLVSSQDDAAHEVARPRPRTRGWGPSFGNFMLALLGSGVLTTVWMYKAESASIGFCETGRNTNEILEGLKVRRAAVEECNRQNRTTLFSILPDSTQDVPSPKPTQVVGSEGSDVVFSEACPPPPFIPLPQPQTCQPCPEHAACTPAIVTCENGYLLRPHPLLSFLSIPSSLRPIDNQNAYVNPSLAVAPTFGNKGPLDLAYTGLSLLLDGMPGLGPVALPPRCVEDPKRKRHIGALGKAIESILAAERGRRLCAGVRPDVQPIGAAQEAKKWGIEIDVLKENLRKDAAKKKNSPQLLSTLEDTYNEAIQQLVEWGGVFIGEDERGHRYIAHRTPKMDMLCTVKVKALDSWSAWWKQILGTVGVLLATQAAKHRRRQRLEDRERVAVLVDTVFDMLRNQELAHQADPISAPRPYIPSTQLRDAVLQGEHSVATRQRLWKQVEHVVEANANVRTNLEEVGGDELRVWRWVGSVGQTLPYELRAESLPATPATPA